jgi:hypothetical protein
MSSRLPLALATLLLSLPAMGQLYDFTITAPTSGLSGPLLFEASTTGTLIGNYHEVNNPTGTRTKPGLFGTFGPTENEPVPANLGLQVGGPIATRTAGGFSLDLNPGAGTLGMSGFAADFLDSGPASLPITLGLMYESFRTRNPTSTYIGGLPLSIPFGEAALTQMTGQQAGPAAGSLTQTGANTYDFSIAAVMLITAEFTTFGGSFQIPGLPAPFGLSGSLTLDGAAATLTSLTPLSFSAGFQPNLALPQLPLELPTILPPGETAQLLMDLVLTDLDLSFDGLSTINAAGVLVPAPATASLLVVCLFARRRRGRPPLP